jgi:hypothetical protein
MPCSQKWLGQPDFWQFSLKSSKVTVSFEAEEKFHHVDVVSWRPEKTKTFFPQISILMISHVGPALRFPGTHTPFMNSFRSKCVFCMGFFSVFCVS